MFEEIIFKKKLKFKLKEKKSKRISSLYNTNINFPLNNMNELSKPKKYKIDNSLTIKQLSRNQNDYFGESFLINTPKKDANSFFGLSSSNKINHNILKILQNQIKPYAQINKSHKINNQYLGRKKIDLIVKHYFEEKEKVFPWKNPFKDYKEPLFLYEILDLNKYDNEMPIIPLSQRNDNNKMIYNLKTIKNQSPSKSHSKNLNSIIHKNEKLRLIRHFKSIKKEENRKIYDIEMKDKIETPPLQLQKIRKLIYKYLTKEANIKEIIDNEIFYKSYENRVNFIYDGLKLPTIKNNFINHNIDHRKEWKNINAINPKLLIFLNLLKKIIQRKKDKIKDSKKNSKKYSKKGTFLIYLDKTIRFKDENEDYDIEKLDKEFLFECDKYFYDKTLYKNINIPKKILLKQCVYNKFKIIEKEKYETII